MVEWIARILGAFYIVATLAGVRQLRLEFVLSRALEKLTNEPDEDRFSLAFMTVSLITYFTAGVALVFLSVAALWILGGGLVMQALYYPLAWHLADEEERTDTMRWQSARNAAIVSASSFAFASYAWRVGVLT